MVAASILAYDRAVPDDTLKSTGTRIRVIRGAFMIAFDSSPW
jgi:hypothetical protein